MALELAKAYVQIVPTTKDLGNSITKEFESAGDAAGKKGGKKGGSAFSKAFSAAATAAGATIAAAATAVSAITKTAVTNFSEYEQLVGGAQLMFGEAYDSVAERAANAYATVQMSQNDYLQQVNGFATGLKTALGGDEQAAADLADKIITAEADIVAATGNSQEAVQNAFNGIMKSNFTMLDNLQLGITPTQEGFQELIDKVNEWNAANGEATSYQMGNLADMQSALVDYVEMQGLAGYAANEASETISGSWAATTAAWDNLLVGMADGNADIELLVQNLVSTVVGSTDEMGNHINGFLDNLLPVIVTALEGIGTAVEMVAPIISEKLPGIVESVLPQLIGAATTMINGLVAALPVIISILADQAPMIVEMLVQGLVANLPALVTAGLQLIAGLVQGIINSIPVLLEGALQAAKALLDAFLGFFGIHSPSTVMQSAGVNLMQGLSNGIRSMVSGLMSQVISIGQNLILGIRQGIQNMVSSLWQTMVNAVQGVINGAKRLLGIASPSKVFAEIGGYTMEGFAEGILRNEELVTDAMRSASDLATGSFTSTLTVNAAAADRAAPTSTAATVAQEIAAALRNVRVYIDGQRMVGYLVPSIDTALGVRQLAAERGAL